MECVKVLPKGTKLRRKKNTILHLECEVVTLAEDATARDKYIKIEEDPDLYYMLCWFDVADSYTREELEKAMNILEHFNLQKGAKNRYGLCGNGAKLKHRRRILGELFPTEEDVKLKKLQNEISMLQKQAATLEQELYG